MLKVAPPLGDLADIYLWIEVGGKGLSVVASIAVNNIELVNFIKMMLGSPGGEHVGDAGVKARAEQGHNPFFFKAFPVGPLPLILKFCHIRRFIVGCVKIINSPLQTGIHKGQILIRQGHI